MTYPSDLVKSSLGFLCGLEWGLEVVKMTPPTFQAYTPMKDMAMFEIIEANVVERGVLSLEKIPPHKFSVIYIPWKKGDNVLLVETKNLKSLTITGEDLAKIIIRRAEIDVEAVLDAGLKKHR